MRLMLVPLGGSIAHCSANMMNLSLDRRIRRYRDRHVDRRRSPRWCLRRRLADLSASLAPLGHLSAQGGLGRPLRVA